MFSAALVAAALLAPLAVAAPASAAVPGSAPAAAQVAPKVKTYDLTTVAAAGLNQEGALAAAVEAPAGGGTADPASWSGWSPGPLRAEAASATGSPSPTGAPSATTAPPATDGPAPSGAPAPTAAPSDAPRETAQPSTVAPSSPASAPSAAETPSTEAGDDLAALTPSLPVKAAPMVIGASWQGGGSARVELRVLTDGDWGEWQPLDVENAADGAEGEKQRGGTEPFVVTGASDVQVRLLGESAPAGAKAFVVDPGSSRGDAAAVAENAPVVAPAASGPAPTAVRPATFRPLEGEQAGAQAATAVPKPAIGSRASWGADESLRHGEVLYGTVEAGVVHHTAGSNSYTADEVPAILRGIYAFHVNGRGWNDIGYNLLADKFGRLWEGRYGGLDKAVVGAQVSGYNSVSFGISMLGTFNSAAPPAVAITAVEKAIAWKFGLAGVLAGTTTTLVGKTYPTIVGHRDLGSTDCPGTAYYAKLPAMRTAVRGLQDQFTALEQAKVQIPATFAALGGAAHFGAPSGGIVATGSGYAQNYANGNIYYSIPTGAHAVMQGIRTRYTTNGAATGAAGFPTTDESKAPDGVGAYNHFTGGSIHWSPATGAHFTHGAIRTEWQGAGWEKSVIGYPRTEESCGLKNAGCYQHFAGGSIHWSKGSGVHITYGVIRDAWEAIGWEESSIGYPRTDEACGLKGGGCYQHFEAGSIHWSKASGAHVTTGAIRDAWEGSGWENGRLGYPTGNEQCNAAHTTCVQSFQGGSATWNSGRAVVLAYR